MIKKELKLLDCTLRDGGYVNDWLFGKQTIRSVVTRLDNSGIDIIECGFLDSRVQYDEDRCVYPDMQSIAKTLGNAIPKQAMLVAMIDYGTFDENLLIPKKDCVLDGIRLIFKKDQINTALDYAAKIKNFGYKFFLNPVAFTSYRDIEAIQLVEKVNYVKPAGISIVDTYGLMFSKDIDKYIYIVNSNLDSDIALGYHCHNNLQMANANSISFINKNLMRNMIIDSSVLGMGKNAGNACTELVGSYLCKFGLKELDLNHILDCAYTDILRFNTKAKWGYGLETYLSAIHDCSPNWTNYLINKGTLSVKDIRAILDMLPFEKREVSFFNKELAEKKYIDYMDRFVNDNEAINMFTKELSEKNILLLCPGKSLETHRADINKYISENSPIIITVNFIAPNIICDYAFISNANRYSKMLGFSSDMPSMPKILLSSNIVPSDILSPTYTFNYKTLSESVYGDNSTVLLISLLKKLSVKNIAIAGMDGFDEEHIGNNFFDQNMSSGIMQENINNIIIEQLHNIAAETMNIQFITPSIFNNIGMRRYKAVIFDMDGTLFDTREGIVDTLKHTINKLKLPMLSDDLLSEFVGPPIQNSFTKHFGFSSSQAQEATNIFREHYGKNNLLKAKPYCGISKLMNNLSRQNLKIGIATYKREDYTLTLLKHFNIYKFCDSVCGSDYKNTFTKTDIMQNCLNQLNIRDCSEAVMVGDSKYDAISAAELGIDFIGVTYGFGFKNESDVSEHKNVAYAKDVNTLDELLKRRILCRNIKEKTKEN